MLWSARMNDFDPKCFQKGQGEPRPLTAGRGFIFLLVHLSILAAVSLALCLPSCMMPLKHDPNCCFLPPFPSSHDKDLTAVARIDSSTYSSYKNVASFPDKSNCSKYNWLKLSLGWVSSNSWLPLAVGWMSTQPILSLLSHICTCWQSLYSNIYFQFCLWNPEREWLKCKTG